MFKKIERYVIRNTIKIKKIYFAIDYKNIYCYNFLYSVLRRRKKVKKA